MAQKQILDDWITEFNTNFDNYTRSTTDLQAYAIRVFNYPELINTLFATLDDNKSYDKYLSSICTQLFCYYRSEEQRLRLLALTFLPPLIGINLTNCCSSFTENKRQYICVDTLLLGIYNLEVVNEDGQPCKRSFRVPMLSKPSVYHENVLTNFQVTVNALTENALLKLETGLTDSSVNSFGPHREFDSINAGNRMCIMSVILRIFHSHMSSLPKQAHPALCKMAIKILRHGTGSIQMAKKSSILSGDRNSLLNYTDLISKGQAKIQMSSAFLVSLLMCVYVCIFNGCSEAGLTALEEIHQRATSNLYSNVLLMTNAIKNSFKINPIGQSDDSNDVNFVLSPTSNVSTTNISKTAITNASFRTKKLPDDIPIVTSNAANIQPHLTSINEENAD